MSAHLFYLYVNMCRCVYKALNQKGFDLTQKEEKHKGCQIRPIKCPLQ